jgi:hypothetical protein
LVDEVGAPMLREIAFSASALSCAVAGGGAMWVIWNQLIRAEIFPNSSLEWFTTAWVIWSCVCFGIAALLYRRRNTRAPADSARVTDQGH